MYTDNGVENAVWKAVTIWAAPDGPGGFDEQTQPTATDRFALTNIVQDELAKLPEDHEVRSLKFRLKNMGRELGKAGHRVYDLRCQVAETRSLINISPGSYRSLYVRMKETERKNEELQARLKEIENPVPEGGEHEKKEDDD